MTESDDWLQKHKGRYLKTVGMIWVCYDECRCEQAQVVSYYANLLVPRARVPISDWQGTFTTGEERDEGSAPSPDAELAEYRQALRLSDPEREASIEWQRGVNYAPEEPPLPD